MASSTTSSSTPIAAAAAAESPLSSAPATPPTTTPATTSTEAGSTGPAPAAPPTKPKRARRATTAERRASHNAVERARRETLNGRFLTLARMLPPLAALRRPSKAAIVNSSIATVHAARRHRLLAAQSLRALCNEAEALRREVNEWRARARVPGLESPVRSAAHEAVLHGELEELDVDLALGEDGEDGDIEELPEGDGDDEQDEPETPAVGTPPMRFGAGAVPQHAAHQQQHQQRFAFEAPSPESPPTPATPLSAGSSGWENASQGSGPRTPPTPAVAMPARMDMEMAKAQHQQAMMGMGYDAPGMGMGYGAMDVGMAKGFAAYPQQQQHHQQQHHQQQHAGAGAAYDLGLGMLDSGAIPAHAPARGDAAMLMGSGSMHGVSMGMGGGGMAYGMGMGMGAGMAMDGSWATVNPAHPAFHARGGIAMGAGVGPGAGMYGLAPGQYLHQPQQVQHF